MAKADLNNNLGFDAHLGKLTGRDKRQAEMQKCLICRLDERRAREESERQQDYGATGGADHWYQLR